jgi:hypothetical protein
MKKSDIAECVDIITFVLSALNGSVPSSSTSSQLRADIGALNASSALQIAEGTAAASLQQCFADATAAGATLMQMSGVLSDINTLTPVSTIAVQLVQLCVILALSQESNIIAATSFTDRETVESTMAMMKAQFDPAIENAADTSASDVMMALIALQSQVVQYLLVTEQPLPFLVEYQAGKPLPSFVLATRLYADPNDVELLANQLVAQNQVVNPAFMPLTGLALSAP